MRSIDCFLEDELVRAARNLKAIATSSLGDSLAGDDRAALRHLLAAPDLRGLEIFSKDGRRVWSAGEPLELIAYRLDRETTLTHHSREGARFEIFWPASQLAADYGLAARLDASWHQTLRRDMLRAILVGSAAIAVTVLIVSLTLLRLPSLPLRAFLRH